MRFVVPLVAALVPLLITPGWLAHFDITPKVAILLFGLTLIFLYPSANVHNFYELIGSRAGRWFAGLLAAGWTCSALASAFSTNVALSIHGSTWRRYGLASESGLLLFALLAAGWLAAEPDNVRLLLRVCTAAGALAALYGIAQYFGWDPLLPVHAYEAGEGALTIVRPPGTLGHADYFAAWLVVIVFLALALRRLEPAGWRKVAAGAVAALAVAAIILSGTRSAMLGLMAGAIVYASAQRSRVKVRALALGAACAAGLVVFFFSPAGARLRARLHWSVEDALGGARLLLWRDSLRMAAHRPLAGFGPETFATEFPRFESLQLARAYPDFYHESPHNMFLDALASQGGLGLLALLGLCGLGVWAATLGLRSGRPLAAPLAAALAGLLVAQQFVVFVFATALYFYLLIGLLIAGLPARLPRRDKPRESRLLQYSGLAVSVILLAFAVRLVVADAALAASQRRIAAGDALGAARAYRVVLRWQPPGAGDDLDYSRAMQQLSASTTLPATRLVARGQAVEAGIRAVSTAEARQNAWYNLSVVLASGNDVATVERSLRNSIACAPNWFKPHWALARVLELTHRQTEALTEARTAVERDGGRDAEVTATWNRLKERDSRQP
ncbi:MAG: O-antigen ligase family protein [Acidobacteriia bacterium]|nr:O-antigen ligase family protein [Terriglobia bacterium]